MYSEKEDGEQTTDEDRDADKEALLSCPGSSTPARPRIRIRVGKRVGRACGESN